MPQPPQLLLSSSTRMHSLPQSTSCSPQVVLVVLDTAASAVTPAPVAVLRCELHHGVAGRPVHVRPVDRDPPPLVSAVASVVIAPPASGTLSTAPPIAEYPLKIVVQYTFVASAAMPATKPSYPAPPGDTASLTAGAPPIGTLKTDVCSDPSGPSPSSQKMWVESLVTGPGFSSVSGKTPM